MQDVETKPSDDEVITSFKGFDKDFTCRGFQFEVGKTYVHDGKVEACEGGFHACEYPLDIWNYYAPSESRFASVKQSGQISRHSEATKIASAKITIEAEIKLPDLIQRAVEWIVAQTKSDVKSAESGDMSASTNTGYRSVSTSTGDMSASTNTGYMSVSTSTGERSVSTSTGERSVSTNTGKHGIALASGVESRVMGADGCALFLVYRNKNDGAIEHAWAGIAGRNGVKPEAWYTLNSDGLLVEVGAAS